MYLQFQNAYDKVGRVIIAIVMDRMRTFPIVKATIEALINDQLDKRGLTAHPKKNTFVTLREVTAILIKIQNFTKGLRNLLKFC